MTFFASFEPTSPNRVWLIGVLAALVILVGWADAVIAQDYSTETTETTNPSDPANVETSALPSVLAQFTTAVENREPIDQVTFVSNDIRKIFFFSDLRGMQGQTVSHRWVYDGKTVAEVAFEVRGPRWRVWSSKELFEDWIGDWTVEIVNSDGEVVAAETFTYSAPDA